MSCMDLLGKLASSVRLMPALVSSVLAGLLICFSGGLPCKMKLILLPSLVVYSVGVTLIGTLHRTLGYIFQANYTKDCNDKTIPDKWMVATWVLHSILFVAFIIYNFCKGSL